MSKTINVIRYKNLTMYSKERGCYVTSEDLLEYILNDFTVIIKDHLGENITEEVLIRAVVNKTKKNKNVISEICSRVIDYFKYVHYYIKN